MEKILVDEIMRLFTPALVGIVGWFIIRSVSRIEKDIRRNTDNIEKNNERFNDRLSVIDDRLIIIETEHKINHKKFQ